MSVLDKRAEASDTALLLRSYILDRCQDLSEVQEGRSIDAVVPAWREGRNPMGGEMTSSTSMVKKRF